MWFYFLGDFQSKDYLDFENLKWRQYFSRMFSRSYILICIYRFYRFNISFTISTQPQHNLNLNLRCCAWNKNILKMTLHHHHPPLPPPPPPPETQCQVDICQGNICPVNICPFRKYLSCYWPDVEQTFKVGSWNHLTV